VTLDKSFSTKDIYNVAKRFRSMEPDQVEMLTLPTLPANVGGATVLRLKQPDAGEIVDRFNGRTPTPGKAAAPGAIPNIPVASIRVRVLNGTGAQGQASEVSAELSKQGFAIAGQGSADSFKYIQPVIRYGKGQLDKAKVLQAYVLGGAQLREDLTLRGIDLVLVTGAQFEGIRNPTAVPPSTTTTAKPKAGSSTTATTAKGAKAPAPQPEC
jgi:hypothetical protein